MAYEPTTWSDGDIVTAEKLNKIEQGVTNAGAGAGVMVIHMNIETGTLDKTWQEIYDALENGTICTIPIDVPLSNPGVILCIVCNAREGSLTLGGPTKFIVAATNATVSSSVDVSTEGALYVSDTADGYPVITFDDSGSDDSGGEQ